MVDFRAVQLLRGHVAERSQSRAGGRQDRFGVFRCRDLRESEVGDFDASTRP